MTTRLMSRAAGCAVLLMSLLAAPVAAQPPVSVNAAVPPEGAQDTVGLLVKITGKNFAPGARADFFRSGTSDPAGVTVRSARVVSTTEIEATVDIAATASLSKFDIRVTNSNGRSGKGSDLFTVVEKATGNAACVPSPLPANVTLVQRLNGVAAGQPSFSRLLGRGIGAKEVLVNGTPSLLLAAPADPGIEVFFLSEGAGGMALVDVVNPHRRLTAPGMSALFPAVVGDFNGDGAPDVVAGNRNVGRAFVFLGSWNGQGHLAFGPALPVPPPSSASYYSDDIAVGDLDPSSPGDEIAIGQWAGQQGKTKFPGRVYLYKVVGTSVVALSPAVVVPTLTPALAQDDHYGQSVAIADVTGSSDADLIVSAVARRVGALDNGGEVYVFPGPTFDTEPSVAGLQPHIVRPHVPLERFGFGLGAGHLNGDNVIDLLVTTFFNSPVVGVNAALGPIGPGEITAPGYGVEVPQGDFSMGFGSTGVAVDDLDGDGDADMAVGAPDTEASGSCPKTGTVFVWRGTGSAGAAWHAPLSLMAPEQDPGFAHFGWRVLAARVGTLRFLIVGEPQRDLGGVEDAGQIYLYRVSTP